MPVVLGGSMLIPCVLLAQLAGWATFLPGSREPLMGFAAYLPLGYQLLWCAIAVSPPKRLSIAMGIVLVAAIPAGAASWFVVSAGFEIFDNFGYVIALTIGLPVVSVANAFVITAPLMLVEKLLADTARAHHFALRHALGAVAVLPMTMAALNLHLGVYSVRTAVPWLFTLPTPLLVLAYFLLEAGAAVPHALLTLPHRVMRAWISLPLVALIAWGATTAAREVIGTGAAEQYRPLQNVVRFAARIDSTRERVPGVR